MMKTKIDWTKQYKVDPIRKDTLINSLYHRGIRLAGSRFPVFESSKLRVVTSENKVLIAEAASGKVELETLASYTRLFTQLAEIWETSDKPQEKKFVEVMRRFNEPENRLPDAHVPEWAYNRAHKAHPDPEKKEFISFYKDYKDLVRDRRTRLRPGRFYKFLYPSATDTEVKKAAENYNDSFKPVEIKFIESDDPDGWEWAYENGRGFTSCMTYNRDSRHLHRDCCGEYHPARVYAYPGNGLRLAYIEKGGKVVSRSIVHEDEDEDFKGYVRVYGDDRLENALESRGYELTNLEGVKLKKIQTPDGNWVMPYLDGIGTVSDQGDYWLIDEDGEYDAENANGLLNEEDDEDYTYCSHCEEHTHVEEMTLTMEGEAVCDYCLDRHYIHAQTRYGYEYVPTEDAVVAADGTVFLDDHYVWSRHGYAECEETGELYPLDDLYGTDRGYFSGDYVVTLEEEYEGYNYAHEDDVIVVVSRQDIEKGDTQEVFLHEDTPINDDGLSECGEWVVVDSNAYNELIKETENV